MTGIFPGMSNFACHIKDAFTIMKKKMPDTTFSVTVTLKKMPEQTGGAPMAEKGYIQIQAHISPFIYSLLDGGHINSTRMC